MSAERTARASGFSLLETMVALLLLSMALLSTSLLLIRSRQSLERTVRLDRAQRHAEALLDVMQVLPAGHPVLHEGWQAAGHGTGIDLRAGAWPWPGAEGLICVEVEATWGAETIRAGHYRMTAVVRSPGRS